MAKLNKTIPTTIVVMCMLELQPRYLYAQSISDRTGIEYGSVHAILQRLQRAGWITSEYETGDKTLLKRPWRRFYTFTETGTEQARIYVGMNPS